MNREEYVKSKIREQGFTLKEYAKHISMPYSSLLSMLSGNLGGASLENVIKICSGLGINLSVLHAKDGIEDGTAYELTYKEKMIISQYRAMPKLQEAVDKLLEIE